MAEENTTFQSNWPEDSQVDGGVLMPLDIETRTPHPVTIPQNVADLALKTSRYYLSTPLKSFLLFAKLPIELRKRVWFFTLPGSRTVEICYDCDLGICTSSTPIPITLSVCKESREEALIFYKLSFGILRPGDRQPKRFGDPEPKRGDRRVYFDFNIDTFYIPFGNLAPRPHTAARRLIRALDVEELGKVKHLAFDNVFVDPQGGDSKLLSFWSRLGFSPSQDFFTGLESLTIVIIPSDLRSSQPSSELARFDGDILLSRIQKGGSEYYAWNIGKDGIAKPWALPGGVAKWEVAISYCWRLLEVGGKPKKIIATPDTLRFASLERLSKSNQWKSRNSYLSDQLFLPGLDCLWEKTEILETLIQLREEGDIWWDYLAACMSSEYHISTNDDENVEPMGVYCSDESEGSCACKVSHPRRRMYTDEQLIGTNLRYWAAFVLWRKEKRERPDPDYSSADELCETHKEEIVEWVRIQGVPGEIY